MESELISFIPKTSTVNFDIMIGQRWCGQIKFTLLPGFKYKEKELNAMALEKRPSLTGKNFVLVPTNQKV